MWLLLMTKNNGLQVVIYDQNNDLQIVIYDKNNDLQLFMTKIMICKLLLMTKIMICKLLFMTKIMIWKIVSSPDTKGHESYCYHWASVIRLSLAFYILINSSKTTGPIWTKLWWNGPWMAPFQNCVRWSWLSTKMATNLKIEKKRGWNFNCPLLL